MNDLLNAAEDAKTRHQLVAHLSGVCGGSLALSADRGFKALFADKVTDWLSFHGRLVHQASLKDSQLYPVVTEVLEQRGRVLNVARIEIPKTLKLAFKCAQDRHQRHSGRSSQSTSHINI